MQRGKPQAQRESSIPGEQPGLACKGPQNRAVQDLDEAGNWQKHECR